MFWWVVLGIGALLAGTAIVITVAVLCLKEIIKAIVEYIKKVILGENKNLKLNDLGVIIEKKYRNGDFIQINIGIRNASNEKIDNITIQSTEEKQDFYEGQIITLSEVC